MHSTRLLLGFLMIRSYHISIFCATFHIALYNMYGTVFENNHGPMFFPMACQFISTIEE